MSKVFRTQEDWAQSVAEWSDVMAVVDDLLERFPRKKLSNSVPDEMFRFNLANCLCDEFDDDLNSSFDAAWVEMSTTVRESVGFNAADHTRANSQSFAEILAWLIMADISDIAGQDIRKIIVLDHTPMLHRYSRNEFLRDLETMMNQYNPDYTPYVLAGMVKKEMLEYAVKAQLDVELVADVMGGIVRKKG